MAGDKKNRRCFRTTVENVAVKKDFYTVEGHNPPDFMEEIWGGYEASLSKAIDGLVNESVDALTWAGVLVPFVASLLVRGLDFPDRYAARLEPILRDGLEAPAGNTNLASMLELQRLLAPILAARWIVASAQGGGSVITNDTGFGGYRAPQAEELGLMVPLTRRHILQLVPRTKNAVAEAKDGNWYPLIEYRRLSAGNHLKLNTVMVAGARRFIFGADEPAVCGYVEKQEAKSVPPLEPFALGFAGGRLARVHEFTWHHLVSALSRPTSVEGAALFELDSAAIARVWKPVIIVPVDPDQTVYPPGLFRDGDRIFVDLYDVPGLTDTDIDKHGGVPLPS